MYEFALDLHEQLDSGGDLVWSPYSVVSALALVTEGARGRTREELARLLPGDLRLAEAAALEDVEIAVANTLWLREGLPIEEAYERAVAAYPGSAAYNAPFRTDPDRARQAINTDVEKTTHELIKNLLPAGAVGTDTAAVVVNALYLKAGWLRAFAKKDTLPAPFHGPGGRRRVPMMRQVERMPYAEADGWRMVTLPADGGVVADILLNEEAGEEAAPSAATLRRLYGAARSVRVDLAVPRFRVEGRASLTDPLRRQGVTTAFTDDADFSGMTPERVLIDRVEHKAVLDVDEQGFEGAAATAVVMVLASMDLSRPVEFRADRPFLVIVRHPATDTVYFLARVTEPAAE
jgi:serine protease inhibitor